MARRKGLTFYQKKKKLNIALIHEIISWIFWIVMSIILALLVVYCIGMKTSIIGSFYGTQSVQWTGDFPEQAGL